MPGMNIFFDTDFTLIGLNGSLRPYVREVFGALRDHGFTVYMWSGARVPWDIVTVFELGHLVKNCYSKPIEDHHNQIQLLSIPDPHFCVDDNEGPIEVFGGYVVPPYIYVDQPDDHILRAYFAIVKKFGLEPLLEAH